VAAAGPSAEAGREILGQARAELQSALREVQDLAHGIYPRILLEHGLLACVEALAESAPTPITYTVQDARWSREVELTAYFVVCEALTNAYKHAQARTVHVHAESTPTGLVVTVHDDGSGGAQPANGTGLVGLEDRVAAIGGTLSVDSAPGTGTTVTAILPRTLP
jgi:signal transduction histidine kinase